MHFFITMDRLDIDYLWKTPVRKMPNFYRISCVGILWKRTVSVEFWAIHSKLCGYCAFLQNLQTRKLGEILEFYTVHLVHIRLFFATILFQ